MVNRRANSASLMVCVYDGLVVRTVDMIGSFQPLAFEKLCRNPSRPTTLPERSPTRAHTFLFEKPSAKSENSPSNNWIASKIVIVDAVGTTESRTLACVLTCIATLAPRQLRCSDETHKAGDYVPSRRRALQEFPMSARLRALPSGQRGEPPR